MSAQKQKIRQQFRAECLKRDGNKCRMCGKVNVKLDVHHIESRKKMPNGGYVKENGISLCDTPDGCHAKAEQWHATGKCDSGFAPHDLYILIGSSKENAEEASKKL